TQLCGANARTGTPASQIIILDLSQCGRAAAGHGVTRYHTEPLQCYIPHEITREYRPRPFTILDRRFTRCRQSWLARSPADSHRGEAPAVPARGCQNRLQGAVMMAQ